MQLEQYSEYGRTLLVKFTCQRCKKECIEPLEKHKNDNHEHYGFLRTAIKPPEGWADLLHGPLLCPDCIRAYKDFMNNGDGINAL